MLGNKLGFAQSLFLMLSLVVASILSPFAIGADHKLNLVTFVEPPYVFPKGNANKGLVVQIVEELMERAQQDYSLTILPPKRALLHAIRTSNTCVFPVERSQEREVKLRWVSPILISRNGFYATKTKGIEPLRVLNDVKDYRIGSVLGSAIGEYLLSLGFSVDLASDNRANLVKLNRGRIDLWAVDTLTAEHVSKENNVEIDEAKLIFFTALRAIGCNLDVPANKITRMNQELAKMYQDGFIEKIKPTATK